MIDFIIAGASKSGSTLLCHTLNTIDNFEVFGEILSIKGGKPVKKHPDQEEITKMRRRTKKHKFYSWLCDHRNFSGREYSWNSSESRKLDLYEYLDTFIGPKNKHVGFKLLHHHLNRAPEILDYIEEHNIKVILLVRENKFNQAMSSFRKQQRHPFSVDPERFKRKMEELSLREYNFKAILKERDITHMVVGYGTLTGNIGADELNIKDIKNFLNIKEMPNKVKAIIKKKSPTSKLLANKNQIEKYLNKNT